MSEKSDWEQGYDQAQRRFYEERKVLNARIAELEQDLSNKEIEYTDLWDDALALQSRIAELEEQAWNLNLENERIAEAYWIDESITPDGTLKPSVRKLLERLEKAETDLRLSDDLVKALDNRIAELEAAQRWHVVGDGDLPIVGKSIMFYDSSSEEIYRGVYTASHHWLANYFSEKCETVTHWMPLPARPEVQE